MVEAKSAAEAKSKAQLAEARAKMRRQQEERKAAARAEKERVAAERRSFAELLAQRKAAEHTDLKKKREVEKELARQARIEMDKRESRASEQPKIWPVSAPRLVSRRAPPLAALVIERPVEPASPDPTSAVAKAIAVAALEVSA